MPSNRAVATTYSLPWSSPLISSLECGIIIPLSLLPILLFPKKQNPVKLPASLPDASKETPSAPLPTPSTDSPHRSHNWACSTAGSDPHPRCCRHCTASQCGTTGSHPPCPVPRDPAPTPAPTRSRSCRRESAVGSHSQGRVSALHHRRVRRGSRGQLDWCCMSPSR